MLEQFRFSFMATIVDKRVSAMEPLVLGLPFLAPILRLTVLDFISLVIKALEIKNKLGNTEKRYNSKHVKLCNYSNEKPHCYVLLVFKKLVSSPTFDPRKLIFCSIFVGIIFHE